MNDVLCPWFFVLGPFFGLGRPWFLALDRNSANEPEAKTKDQ